MKQSNDIKIPVDTYHQFLEEAFEALSNSLELQKLAHEEDSKSVERYDLLMAAGMSSRYAFLVSSSGLEAAANALLLSLEINSKQYSEYERLSTILKYELFCLYHSKRLDRNNPLFGRIKEVVQCRNEFVHPKPKMAETIYSYELKDSELLVDKTKLMSYPLNFSLFEPENSLNAIKDILSFISWVVFDICGYSVQTGSLILGLNSSGITGTIITLSSEYNLDIRSFGEY